LQPGQRGSSLLRNDKSRGSVILEMEIDGKTIIIERGLQRKKSVNQSYTKIIIDGEEKEMSITELKNKILSLLQYPKEFAKKTNILYRFTVYTPQEQMRQIILETPEVRLNTLRHIFGIDKYRRIRENTETLTAKLREQIREYEGQIKDLDGIRRKLEEKQAGLENIEKNIKVFAEELEERRKERTKQEQELEEIKGKIKEKEKYEREEEKTIIMLGGKRELITNLNKEISRLFKEIEEAKKIKFEEKELVEKAEEKQEKEKELDEKNKLHLELLSKSKSLISKISETEELKEQISALKLCPTCLQAVDESYKKNIIRKLDEGILKYKKEIDKLKEEKEKANMEIEKLNSEMQKLKKEID
jgi:DNA repair exonuclease SbcCD ATPase subunit